MSGQIIEVVVILSSFFSLLGFFTSLYCLVELLASKRSTHRVELRPAESFIPKPDVPPNGEQKEGQYDYIDRFWSNQ